MKFLFVKHALAWPRAAGHDVHGYYMMRALSEGGHAVVLATVTASASVALDGAGLEATYILDDVDAVGDPITATRMQERFRRYFGIETTRIGAVRKLARELKADAVVAVGLEVLPYLTGVIGSRRVWYAADEWLWHHVSQVKVNEPRSWHHVTDGMIKGLYERAYRGVVDVTWVVSEADRRAMQSIAGMRSVAIVPNGVDTDFFQPQQVREVPNSAVFWGRLDFGPNVDALTWFCREIWTELRRVQPDATFTIIGYEPSEQVLQLARQNGIAVKPNVVDLRLEACRHAVTVLPFVSGGGIKNKLLEAAALQRPIVCSPTAVRGLNYGAPAPFVLASSRSEWIGVVRRLWADQDSRDRLGEAARAWVKVYHSWATAAETAVNSLGPHAHAQKPHDATHTQQGISS
jgi:glycosyltransferase involved in cell wall biosynthesis